MTSAYIPYSRPFPNVGLGHTAVDQEKFELIKEF
jgi:hypothetical protein